MTKANCCKCNIEVVDNGSSILDNELLISISANLTSKEYDKQFMCIECQKKVFVTDDDYVIDDMFSKLISNESLFYPKSWGTRQR